jgi:lysophospholipase L1-like esterase
MALPGLTKAQATRAYAPKGASTFPAVGSYTPAGTYDPIRNLYNVKGSNWFRARIGLARAAAGTGLCRVGVVGTSISAGWTANNATQSWPTVMRDALGTRYGYTVAGTGEVMAGKLGVYSASQQDPRWSGTWSPSGGGATTSYGGYGAISSANGQTYTFTSDFAGTVAEFSYATNTTWTGSFTVTVKNSSGTVLAGPTAYSSTGSPDIVRVTLTGLTLDVGSQIVFTATNTGVNCALTACVRNASGLLVSNFGVGSGVTGTWADTFVQSGANILNGFITKKLFASYDVVLCELGTNDMWGTTYAVSQAQYATNMASLVSNLRSATCDFGFIHPIPRRRSGDAALFPQVAISGYTSADFYKAADANDLPMVDLSDRWQSFTYANSAGLMTDDAHPNATGYRRMGYDIAALLAA